MPSLSKIFGRPKMTYRGVAEQPPISECCINRELMPRWRGPLVMGDDTMAMGFVCHACGREFLPSDVQDRRLIRGGTSVSVPSAAEITHAEQPAPEDGSAGQSTGDDAEAPATAVAEAEPEADSEEEEAGDDEVAEGKGESEAEKQS